MSKPRFCFLVVGSLGTPGEMSLNSIAVIYPGATICAMSDNSGRFWLDEKIKGLPGNLQVCHHTIPVRLSWLLENEDDDFRYSTFGQRKFFRLMHLKWDLIIQCLIENPSQHTIIFSDLDVLWNHRIIDYSPNFTSKTTKALIQKDFNRKGGVFLCPGIMIWENSIESIEILKDIQTFHERLLSTNELMPDDKALNAWFNLNNNRDKVSLLPQTEFVIGHRLLELLLGTSGYSTQKWMAYHANYAQGLTEKEINLRILLWATTSPRKCVATLFVITRMVLKKLKNLPK